MKKQIPLIGDIYRKLYEMNDGMVDFHYVRCIAGEIQQLYPELTWKQCKQSAINLAQLAQNKNLEYDNFNGIPASQCHVYSNKYVSNMLVDVNIGFCWN